MTEGVSMKNTVPTILWRRAWRNPNGVVGSTRPYASKEQLLEAETSTQGANEWCGEPFFFFTDEDAILDYRFYENCDRKREARNGMK